MSQPQENVYFLKKSDGSVYGPVLLEILQEWAREGRIAPDDLLSKDRELWYPAPTMSALDMNWLVHLADGTQYGPIHLMALQELVNEGSLSPDDLVTDRTTENVCTLREAVAGFVKRKTSALPWEVASPETVETLQSQRGAAKQPQTDLEQRAETIPTTEPQQSPAASAEQSPSIETEPLPADSEKLASHPEVPPQPSWRDLAARKDFLERELLKWKQLYEQEHARALRLERETEERIQAFKKSELSAVMRVNQLERKLRESEENYRVLKESFTNDPAHPYAQQLAQLTELYRDLSQRYDALAALVDGKNSEVAELLESRKQTERHAEEKIRQMQDVANREREEADQARRRALEIEADYLQLVKAYRDLNDRFLQLRQQTIAPAPSGRAAPGRSSGSR